MASQILYYSAVFVSGTLVGGLIILRIAKKLIAQQKQTYVVKQHNPLAEEDMDNILFFPSYNSVTYGQNNLEPKSK